MLSVWHLWGGFQCPFESNVLNPDAGLLSVVVDTPFSPGCLYSDFAGGRHARV